jgi:hypothetical protein
LQLLIIHLKNKFMEKQEEKSNKKLIGAVLIIFLVVVTGYLIKRNSNAPANFAVPNYFSDSDSWKEFNSVEGAFKVNFPTFPSHQTNSINVPESDITGTVELYSSDRENSSYFVQAIRYDGVINISNPQANLEGGFNGRVAEIPNHKIISSKFGTSPSYDWIDYQIQSDNYYIYGRMILIGQRLYSLEMACEISECSLLDYQKFTDSFKLQ